MAIILSTFYLGIHWITDAVLGAAVALTSFYLVDKGYLDSSLIPEGLKSFVKKKLDSLEIISISEI